MTLLLPVAASLCPAMPRPVLTGPVISTEHFWEKISQQEDSERSTQIQQREREREQGWVIWTMTVLMQYLINMHSSEQRAGITAAAYKPRQGEGETERLVDA